MKMANAIFFREFLKPLETMIIADGTSCRCQIKDKQSQAKHVAILRRIDESG